MAKLIYKKRILPDAGKYLVELLSVEEIDNRFYDPKEQSEDKKKQMEWTFRYDEKPEMQIKVWSTASLSTYKGKKSKALTVTEALLQKELTDKEKEEFSDTDVLVGDKCFVTVKHEKNEKGDINAKVVDFEVAEDVEPLPF